MILQMQDRLTILRTSRNISKLTAYEEIKGVFDWNRTPMAPLGNKGVVYITLGMHNRFTSHCDNAYTTGCAPNHHQFLKFYVPATRGYIISGTYRLDPAHWTLSAVSEQEKTVTAAASLLAAFQKFIPTSAADKQKHIVAIPPRVDNVEPQRVDGASPLRVETTPALRVTAGLTPSNSPTCPRHQ